MPRRVLISALAAAVTVLPLPAVALADSSPSAGDSQYVDPLAGTHSSSPSSGSSTPAPRGSSSTPPASAAASSPSSASSPASSSPSSASAGSTGASGDPRGSLPFTGADTELIALIGLGLAGGGLVLRRRGAPARD